MIWYPYEQMKTMKAPYKIIDAEGVYLYTEDQKLIDSVSSWWCMIHGYKHPVKVCGGFYQAWLDGIAQPVLGGLVNYLEWRQGLHSWQRSPGGAGGGKA